MKKRLLLALAVSAAATSLSAQSWSAGVATGPFVFGDFVQRSVKPITELGTGQVTHITMSARTRPGLALDVERELGDHFAVRLEAAMTRSPAAVKSTGGSGVALNIGNVDVTTLIAPVVFRINPHGTFRFHVLAGPADALYHVRRKTPGGSLQLFSGTRDRWGIAAGGGVDWKLRPRFAIEAQLTDVYTASPFERSDFPATFVIRVPRTHNVHTTIGLRWMF